MAEHVAHEPAGEGLSPDDQALDTGHDYDGIRELDSPLPNWWLGIFLVSVVWAYGYWFYYHNAEVGGGSAGEYAEEKAELDKKSAGKPVTEEMLTGLLKDPGEVSQGQKLWLQNCVACHGEQGEGKIGPNLTDDAWLHGAKPTDIHGVIANGFLAKGMPAWQSTLGPTRVKQLVAYVLTLKGRNLPGKAPEGERAAK